PRLGAELELGGAAELDRALLRAVVDVELLEQHARRRRGDPAAGAPRRAGDGAALGQREPSRARQHQPALEARMLALDPHGAIGLDGERAIGRIDGETQPHAAIVAAPAAGNAIAVELAGGDEGALALERAVERADIALEPELVESRPSAARGI